MPIIIRMLAAGDEGLFAAVPPDLFDDPIDMDATREFIADPRHMMAIALDGGVMVGFASAVRYAHPDKQRSQLWVNEVGVSESHRRRGIARRLMRLLVEAGREAGCFEVWVGTEVSNTAARGLYEASGAVEDDDPFIVYLWDLDKT